MLFEKMNLIKSPQLKSMLWSTINVTFTTFNL
jgi:hypothetical protein